MSHPPTRTDDTATDFDTWFWSDLPAPTGANTLRDADPPTGLPLTGPTTAVVRAGVSAASAYPTGGSVVLDVALLWNADSAVQQLAKQPGFRIADVMHNIEMDGQAQDVSKQALLNRLAAAGAWNIFRTSNQYEPIDTIFEPGAVNVVDVSRLESGPRGLRNLIMSIICRNLFRKRADARLREEFGLAAGLPRVWLMIDEAHQFVPAGSATLAKEQIIRWAKEGRQPGLSLVVATQQPSAVDNEVLSQCDIILSHKLTTKADVAALNGLSQDYMGGELRTFIKQLNRSGESVLVDDERESVTLLRIRPRQSSHGGSSIAPTEQEHIDLWNPL